jgi:universal stress protein A
MFDVKKILLPTDFSKLSFAAAAYAADIAKKYNSEIHFLHVLEKSPPLLATMRSFDLTEEKINARIEEDAQTQLDNIISKFKNEYNIEAAGVLRRGVDYEEIFNYCKNEKVDLIILATHGRSGIMKRFIGSVAEKVIKSSCSPVLIIPPPES